MATSWFLSFLRSQLFVFLPYPTYDFSNQTIIITGANTGLGFEAAKHLTRLQASKVILAVRSISKGEAAKASIQASNPLSKTAIEVWHVDLSSYESVKKFAAEVMKLERLDVLLENAGIMTGVFKVVEEDESTVTTNVISTELLALLVLPKLRETAAKFGVQPRLSIVTSDLHFVAKFPERNSGDIFAALKDKEKADMGLGARSHSSSTVGAHTDELWQIRSHQTAPSLLRSGTCGSDRVFQKPESHCKLHDAWGLSIRL